MQAPSDKSPAPRVVVHVPHAATMVPGDVATAFLLTPEELEGELLVLTDRYTDELFALPTGVATTVAFPVSRLVVDPERFVDDDREPMASRGMGVVYTRRSDGRALRHAPSLDERARLLARFYVPHHAALTAAVEAALGGHGSCLVIDAHSFPARALPYEDDQSEDRPEICIGTDPQHTPSRLRGSAVAAFERAGFRVAVDRPFRRRPRADGVLRARHTRARRHGGGEPRAVHERANWNATRAVRRAAAQARGSARGGHRRIEDVSHERPCQSERVIKGGVRDWPCDRLGNLGYPGRCPCQPP